jgi:hypothetical protein
MTQRKDELSLPFGGLANIVKAVTHIATAVVKAPVNATTAAVTTIGTGTVAAVGQVIDLPTDAMSAMVDGLVSKVVAGLVAGMGVAFLVNKLHVKPETAAYLVPLASGTAVAVVHMVEDHVLHPHKVAAA